MAEPISIESTTAKENRISFFEHRNKIIGNLFLHLGAYTISSCFYFQREKIELFERFFKFK